IMPPGFYSLQFDMLQKTPEVFAARGIVALQPSLVLLAGPGADSRTCSLAQGIIDLTDNAERGVDEELSLDSDLGRVAEAVGEELGSLIRRLTAATPEALEALKHDDLAAAQRLTDRVLAELGEYANQGAYLVDGRGRMVSGSCLKGLEVTQRCEILA